MCEMSNRPAVVRTATCSATSEVYFTGIDQPANGTIVAPAATWAAWSGVCRSGTGGCAGAATGMGAAAGAGGTGTDGSVMESSSEHGR
ncbi:hypothetical protein GCM10025875_25260 [Litorihabitans aurantiacus]|uniref:Uncharacterized protein n=1 Tax=Litorihabitans aurantiacus TaxID=1930061 RepID=A0AA37XFZ8_9MICO|nr:hypothetical protein GCM10025875_25260 [Litorihabitans aurantiacus]